ncbi:MAG: SMC-Scp complex subunit ScpB [Bacteroidetes bacterium]|nr:MAG: SMC-Scp complex subunit ScpB [Bacteroidota bacterium]
MEISVIIPHLEALIFASEKPLTTMDLVELVNNALGFIDERADLDQVETALEAIVEKYKSEFYPFQAKQSGGGWQFLTKPLYHKTIAQLNGEKFLKRLSTAALETLAIIAYKQPVTKGEMENIRGVNCDYAVQKLLEKDLVVIIGRREDAPGQPLLYSTSKSFMDYFGINHAGELPSLDDIMPNNIAEATFINQTELFDNTAEPLPNNNLVVTANGDMVEIAQLEAETMVENQPDLTPNTANDEAVEVGQPKEDTIAENQNELTQDTANDEALEVEQPKEATIAENQTEPSLDTADEDGDSNTLVDGATAQDNFLEKALQEPPETPIEPLDNAPTTDQPSE